jgi:hypothetical protein
MKREKEKKDAKDSSKPEKVSAEESLRRTRDFTKRKEKMIAFIIQSKN